MAKELPYFKFETLAFMAGDIYLERWELQGIFYNICAFYWSKDCNVSLTVLGKKYLGSENLIDELLGLGIMDIDEEYISISFLNEQWTSKETQKQVNIINGKKGGRPKKQDETEKKPNGFNFANRNDNRNETHIEYNNSKVDLEVNKEEIGFEDLLLVDNILKEKKSELINALVLHFEFSAPHHKQNRSAIMQFVNSQLLDEDDIEHFKNQFKSYWEYKEISGEKSHGFQSYLGTPAMRFENSGWNAENWGDKLLKFKSNPQNKTKFERAADSFNNAHNPYK